MPLSCSVTIPSTYSSLLDDVLVDEATFTAYELARLQFRPPVEHFWMTFWWTSVSNSDG